MKQIKYKDKTFNINDDGFLINFTDYCNEWIEYNMNLQGIKELTTNHKILIEKVRKYYVDHGIAPMVRILCNTTKIKLKELYELFPFGPQLGLCKTAGLMGSTGCV